MGYTLFSHTVCAFWGFVFSINNVSVNVVVHLRIYLHNLKTEYGVDHFYDVLI